MGNWLQGPWWGKIIGALLGAAVKGPVGAVVGAIVGHQFDLGLLDRHSAAHTPSPESTFARQQLFFYTTFTVMGHIAKSDGRVSEPEIEAASQVMKSWDLNDQQIESAIQCFNQGKSQDFTLEQTLQKFRQAVGSHRPTLLTFVAAQMRIMLADHQIHPATRQRTWEVCQILGVTRVEMASIESQLRGRHHPGSISSLSQAYKQLALSDSASDDEVKTAYRRMMNRYHPDKLVDESHSEQDRLMAKAQLERCRDAWETIKASRGMR